MKNNIGYLRNLYIFLSVVFVAGTGIWEGTIYQYMHKVGFTYGNIDLYLAVFWVATTIAEFPSGAFADTFGRMRTVVLSAVIRAAGLLMLLPLRGGMVPLLLASALFTGLGDSLNSGTLDSWIVDELKPFKAENFIGRLFAKVNSVGLVTKLIIGYVGAQMLAPYDLGLPLLAGAGLFLLLAVLALGPAIDEKKTRGQNSEAFISTLPVNTRQSKIDQINEGITQFKQKFSSCFDELKKNRILLGYLVAFIPIPFIVTGPYNQWQLFYRLDNSLLSTGAILVGINIAELVGTYLTDLLYKQHKPGISVLMLCTAMNSILVMFAAISGNSTISVIFLWIQTAVAACDEMTRYSAQHDAIESVTARSTIISLFNTVEAGSTVLALLVNAYCSDHFGMAAAWLISAVFGGVLSLALYAVFFRKVQGQHA